MSRYLGMPKDWSDLARYAVSQGWTVEARRNSHMVWISPSGDKVWSAASCSDRRAIHKHKAILRRYGLQLPH